MHFLDMKDFSKGRVVVFGGTGYVGRNIVRRLLEHGFDVRVAVRHPEKAEPPSGYSNRHEAVCADVLDQRSVKAAVSGTTAVVNAVSLYAEHGAATFQAIHVDGARHVAAAARNEHCARLVHFSGLGADPEAKSEYIRCRGMGEAAVCEAFPNATVFRPSMMFGGAGGFLARLTGIIEATPVFPLFGDGSTRIQPVHVKNVAEAAGRAVTNAQHPDQVYEFGGPDIFTYRELVRKITGETGRRRILIPTPFIVWKWLAVAAGMLSRPPLTAGEVALMESDKVASPDLDGLKAFNITPLPVCSALQKRSEAEAEVRCNSRGRRSGEDG